MIGNLIRGQIKTGGGGSGSITVEAEAGFALPTSMPEHIDGMAWYYSVEDDTGAQLEAGIAPVTLSGSDAVVARGDASATIFTTVTGLTGTRVIDESNPSLLTLNAGVTVWFGPIAQAHRMCAPKALTSITSGRAYTLCAEVFDPGVGVASTADRIYFLPWYPQAPIRFSELAQYVSTISAGAEFMLAFYLMKGDGMPGALLREVLLSAGASGWVVSSGMADLFMPPVPLWTATVCEDATMALIVSADGKTLPHHAGVVDSGGRYGQPLQGLYGTYSGGWTTPAMPNPAPTSLSALTFQAGGPVIFGVNA